MQSGAYGLQYGSVQQPLGVAAPQQQAVYGASNPGEAYAGVSQQVQQSQQPNPYSAVGNPGNPGNAGATGTASTASTQAPSQSSYPVYEKNAATALMGFPNSVRSITNARTGQVEYYQTQLIVTDLKKNEWGFGINLGDSDGVVRIQGCRSNPDGTKSPGQLNPDIKVGDVLYKVQNTLLTGKTPLNVVGVRGDVDRRRWTR